MRTGSNNRFSLAGALEALVITVSLVLLATAGAGLLGVSAGVA